MANGNWTPTQEDLDRLADLQRLLHERSAIPVDPKDYQMMLDMRDRINKLEGENKRFLGAPAIKDIARLEAIEVMRSAGFDMEHIRETNNQVQWLLSLKRGFKGFLIAVLAAITTIGTTVTASYISGRWWSK